MPLGPVLIASEPLLQVSPIVIHWCDVGRWSARLIDDPRLIIDHNCNTHYVYVDFPSPM